MWTILKRYSPILKGSSLTNSASPIIVCYKLLPFISYFGFRQWSVIVHVTHYKRSIRVILIVSSKKGGFDFSHKKGGVGIKERLFLKGEINALVEFFNYNITLNEKSISYQTSLVICVATALIYIISLGTLCVSGEGPIKFLKSYWIWSAGSADWFIYSIMLQRWLQLAHNWWCQYICLCVCMYVRVVSVKCQCFFVPFNFLSG